MVKPDLIEKLRLRYARTSTSGGLSRLLHLLEQSPSTLRESAEAAELRGDILADLRRYLAAQEAYELALKRDPSNDLVLVALGEVLLEQGKAEEALPRLRQAWETLVQAGSPQALELAAISLSDALKGNHMETEALGVLRRSAERVGESATLTLHRADILLDLHRFDEALAVLEALPAHEVKMGLRKGRAYAGMEQYERACFWLFWELALDPKDLNAMALLVRCLLLAGRADDAMSFVEAFLRRKPKSGVRTLLQQLKQALVSATHAQPARGLPDLEKARKRWIELDRLLHHLKWRSRSQKQ